MDVAEFFGSLDLIVPPDGSPGQLVAPRLKPDPATLLPKLRESELLAKITLDLSQTAVIGGAGKTIPGELTKPGTAKDLPTLTVRFRVEDEAGDTLSSPDGFLASGLDVLTPSLMFFPVLVPYGTESTVRYDVYCELSLTYTPLGAPMPIADPPKTELGPVSIKVPTYPVPLLALVTENKWPDAPGTTIAALPDRFPLPDRGAVIDALTPLRVALFALNVFAKGLPGGAPPGLSVASSNLDTIVSLLAGAEVRRGYPRVNFFGGFLGLPWFRTNFSSAATVGVPGAGIVFWVGKFPISQLIQPLLPLPPTAFGVAAVPDLALRGDGSFDKALPWVDFP